MNKNIRQNYFRHIKRTLDVVEKMGDNAKHFRCIVLMGDSQEQKAYSFMHASPEDLKNLILHAMRHSETFTNATANAFLELNKEIEEREKSENNNNNKDEENPIEAS